MSPNTPSLSIHAGEGCPATGVNEAMKEAPTVEIGSTLVASAAGINNAVQKTTMGLSGAAATFANLTAVGVISYIVLFQMPSQQDRFDRTLDKIVASHERQTDKLATAIDKLTERLGRTRGAIGDFGDSLPKLDCEEG